MSSSSDIGEGRQRMLAGLAVAVSLMVWLLLEAWSSASTRPVSAQVSGTDGDGNNPATSPTPTPVCTPSWSVVNSPNPSTGSNYLFDVTTVSSNDVWAVGWYSSGGRRRTLIIHWNGVQWTQVTSPSPGNDSDLLIGVDAISSNDVWSVGYTHSTGNGWLTLIEHWDGTQWSIVPSPNAVTSENELRAVSAFSANDVWAVGYYIANISGYGYYRTLIEHWDGAQWSIVPSPTVGTHNNEFWDVAAVSPNDVWAVGYYWDTGLNVVQALVQHWDGVQWSVIPFTNPTGAVDSLLYGVSGTSPNDVWAVGNYGISPGVAGTLVEHWDGTQWSIVPSPNIGPEGNNLLDVSALSPHNAWAVGWYCCEPDRLTTIAMHWDGVQWSLTSSPSPLVNNYLYGVAVISESDVWAVGEYDSCVTCPRLTLVGHYSYSPACFTTTPTPTHTPTPTYTPTPTSTGTLTHTPTHTNTPTITPTPLPVLVGHVNWQSRPAQPNPLQQLPITLTLTLDTLEVDYPAQPTDQYGYFTVTVDGLPNGTYSWRADDAPSTSHDPNYLANSGTVDLTGEQRTEVEMGMMRAGDANNDNSVSIMDFNILRLTFGFECGGGGYDNRADFTGDCKVNISDFNPLKSNFGQAGAP